MLTLSDRDRLKLAMTRNHLAAAVNDLPWRPELAPMFRDIQSLMRGCTDLIGGGPLEGASAAEDDAAAGWPEAPDGWHDRPAARRPAYVAYPKADGLPDEKAARFEGCGEPVRHLLGEC
jgi:hypothetical protein